MRLSTSGIIFVISGTALIVAAYRFALPGLLPIGILLIALVLLSALLVLWGARRVSVELTTTLPTVALPRAAERYPLAAEGKEVEVEARVTNTGTLGIPAATVDFVAADGFGDSTVGEVPPLAGGRSQRILTSFTPNRRGIGGIESVLMTVAGPFGLVTTKKRVSGHFPIAVAVPTLPARIPQDSVNQPARLEDGKVRAGHTTRDFHTREYVPGDDMRHVHWPTTAKSGELMVRHEADEETLHALIVIDLAGSDGHPDQLEAEFLIAAAAAAGTAFLRADYEVFVVTPGHEVRFTGQRDIDRLRLLTALIAEGPVTLPHHDNPNHVVICAADESRAEVLAAKFSRRLPVTVRTLSEIDDMTLLGLSEDLPASWTTFDSKRGAR